MQQQPEKHPKSINRIGIRCASRKLSNNSSEGVESNRVAGQRDVVQELECFQSTPLPRESPSKQIAVDMPEMADGGIGIAITSVSYVMQRSQADW